MPKLAKEIRVTMTPDNKYHFTIDGDDFPWWIDADGINVHIGENDAPGVSITILAEHVITDHQFG